MTWHELEFDGPVGPGPVPAAIVGVPDRRVLLVRDAAGVLHATDPACPHLGHPLSMGRVDGDVLECDHHAYRYSLEDGRCVAPGGPLAGFLQLHDVREDADRVLVRLADDGAA